MTNGKIIDTAHLVYSFSGDHTPCITVSTDEAVWIHTLDSYGNQLNREHVGDPIKLQRINPVTGPLFIEGAEKGDTLVVEILAIQVANSGTMYLRQGAGLFGDLLDHAEIRKIPINDSTVKLPGGFSIPKKPMIGVIGTAPLQGSVPTSTPGPHGGNMDTNLLTTGATLYLPVFVEGALFGLGDLHAAMGDGETGICGIEVAGQVQVSFKLIKCRQTPWPLLENKQDWAVIASAPTLDEAAREAAYAMLDFLKQRTDVSNHDLVRLLSIAGNLQISQVVNPLKTVRMVISKDLFGERIIQY